MGYKKDIGVGKKNGILIVGLLLAGLLPLPAMAQNQQDQQELMQKAQTLAADGKHGDAYLLLEAAEEAYAGDVTFDYLLASTALQSGRPSMAIFVHERILAVDPSYIGVRADMGLAHYALGDFARAKIEFESVLAFGNLPPDLRSQVEQYVAAVEARSRTAGTYGNVYAEAGYGHDSNIGSATDRLALSLPASGLYRPTPPIGRRQSDQYSTLAVGGEVNHPIDSRLGLYAGADYRNRVYNHYDQANSWTMDGRAGLSYAGSDWLLRGGLNAGEYGFGGERLRQTVGTNLDWRAALDSSSQLTLGASYTRADYVTSATQNQDAKIYSGSLGWLTALGNGQSVLSLNGIVGQEENLRTRDDGDRQFWGPRLTFQSNFSNQLGGYISTGATRTAYTGRNSSYLLERRELTYDLTLAVNWTMAKGVALRPQVSYIKNDSNAALYSYDKTDVSLNLRFDY